MPKEPVKVVFLSESKYPIVRFSPSFKGINYVGNMMAIEDAENEVASISITNQTTITAGDLGKFISNFQVLNPDLVICNLNKSVNLNFELTIGKGRGYVTDIHITRSFCN